MNQYGDFGKETEELMTICECNNRIPPELFKEFGVKRGLRDVDGTGVLAYFIWRTAVEITRLLQHGL